MDTKRTWGYISLMLGCVSLLWGGIAISGFLGQSQVTHDIGGLLAITGQESIYAVVDIKNKYQLIATIGLILSLFGAWMMKGQWDKH
ncbi:hypothetical protein L4D09_24585 [Photobacterium makurazakiensis]|uniref:hypothetical protein n=1 Tax=Photobacterium makurazakiensis TaxID=2910234 RepID=UPI003D11A39F